MSRCWWPTHRIGRAVEPKGKTSGGFLCGCRLAEGEGSIRPVVGVGDSGGRRRLAHMEIKLGREQVVAMVMSCARWQAGRSWALSGGDHLKRGAQTRRAHEVSAGRNSILV
jgi:hypothetical protein